MSGNGQILKSLQPKGGPEENGYGLMARVRALEADMAVMRTLVKQNNKTLMDIMSAIQKEQTK